MEKIKKRMERQIRKNKESIVILYRDGEFPVDGIEEFYRSTYPVFMGSVPERIVIIESILKESGLT